jgi:hypothetical protein
VTFRPSPPHLHRSVPDARGLRTPTLPRPHSAASHAVRVPRVGRLPAASFRSHLAVDTLAVRLGVPGIKASKGLTPSSHFLVGFRLPVASAARALRAMPGAHRGIGGGLATSPLPHHRTDGSRLRRFGGLRQGEPSPQPERRFPVCQPGVHPRCQRWSDTSPDAIAPLHFRQLLASTVQAFSTLAHAYYAVC